MAQVVEHLSSKRDALSSDPYTRPKKFKYSLNELYILHFIIQGCLSS
jgi:hypothetical protein